MAPLKQTKKRENIEGRRTKTQQKQIKKSKQNSIRVFERTMRGRALGGRVDMTQPKADTCLRGKPREVPTN